jgi:PE_PGRS family protein
MAHRRSKKQDSQSGGEAVPPNARFIRLSVAATTFLALSVSHVVNVPVAKADGEEIIIDQILNSLYAVDPTSALDLSSWLSSLDAALQGAANFDPSSVPGLPDIDSALSAAANSADPTAIPADPAAADSTSLAHLYQTFIYDPGHVWDQEWIAGTTFLGNLTVQWDNALNTFWSDIGGQGMLIGNGADGISALDPNGAAGGLWFGDGGSGWNSDIVGVNGGDGGIAYDGNGGMGGDGFDGSQGGAGGDTSYGVAGDGGAGGDAVIPGGAGGSGGAGGDGTGFFFGQGGDGGQGGSGAAGLPLLQGGAGGHGGAGGNGATLLGDGGDGGNGGAGGQGGIGSAPGGLGGAGGAGGHNGLLGQPGAAGSNGPNGPTGPSG